MIDQTSTTSSPRERLLMDPGWRFHLGDIDLNTAFSDDPHMAMYLQVKTGFAAGPASPAFDDSAWRMVDLPHDWAVEGTFDPANNMDHGYLPTGIGWYRKTFSLPCGDLGKRIYLEFDGVFRNCTVWLNGHKLGTHQSGYTSFRFDVSDVLHCGNTNVLAVRVDATEFEGWWYEGAGIYRHVWLVKTDPLHVAPWGTYVTTTPKSESLDAWEIDIQTTLVNGYDTDTSCRIESVIVDADGNTVATARTNKKLPPDTKTDVTQRVTVRDARLWSVDSPHLYCLNTTVTRSSRGRRLGGVCDTYETRFGLRTIRFDADTGFHLNGQPLKLKGTCNHQDHAGVGVAVPDRVQEYRIKRLKEMGCNAYRCAHNPPAPELLDACDRLGMLVMDETRRMESTPEGLAQLESMLLRDRNHPSIILWSLGNEEPIQGTEVAGRIVATMKRLVRRLDITRPTTIAMNGHWGSPVSQIVDVQGHNYFIHGYDDFRQQFPDKPVVAAENGSTVSTRGIYANDEERGYVSAYDLNHPDWAFLALDSWKAVAERPWMAGTFVWTGFDYRGEPIPYHWPCINSHFGILDVCGFPKDNFYYYKAWWSDETVLHILPHWNWPGKEGQPIDVWVHSNCDEVELFVNGQSLGCKAMERNGHLEWQVNYAPGVLQAKGYRDGQQVATAERKTTGSPVRIVLCPDRVILCADGEDVAMVNVSIVDVEGQTVPTANNLVRFSINSNAHILGVGNGDPSSHEPDKASQRSAFNGLCQAIVQVGMQPGEIQLIAESAGLEPARLVLTAEPATRRPFVPSAGACG